MEIGTEVIYCHEQTERRAQICNIDQGQVHLAVYRKDGTIEFGVTDAKLAEEPAHRITHGYYWRR